MSERSIGSLTAEIVNKAAAKSGRVQQFPEEKEMNANAVVEHEGAVPLPATASPSQMLTWALTNGAAPDVIGKFMDLAERFEKRQERKAFDHAIAAAKAAMPVIAKNREGHNNKRYADFAALARVVDPIISAHGLHYRFRTVQDDKLIHVTCVLSHEAGHAEENTLVGPADASGSKNAIQAIGSTLTYLQRYTLTQALGLAASEDDDGRTAGGGEVISDEQAKTLRDLAEEVGADIPKFCRYLKVESVADIRAVDFDRAVAALEAKRKRT